MTGLANTKRGPVVREMFARIAPRYDFMNRLMTAAQDVNWRRTVIELACLHPGERLLDLGSGTGDLAHEALRQQPLAQVTAADFTLEMMQVGSRKGKLAWSAADALRLPFEDGTFDAIASGFLMRNVADVDQALSEQYRTLKRGGRIVILDTTRPQQNLVSPFIRLHMRVIIPLVGGLVSGDRKAYEYLPESTDAFLSAEELAHKMQAAGFEKVEFRRRMFGTIAIHWAEKAPGSR